MSQISVLRAVSRWSRFNVFSTTTSCRNGSKLISTSSCQQVATKTVPLCPHRAFTTKTTTTPIMMSKLTPNSANYCTEKTTSNALSEQSKTPGSGKRKADLSDVLLSDYEKRKLVLTGYYKSMAEVPDRVSHAKMSRAGDLFRIGVSISTAVVSFVLLMITIKRGQKHRREHMREQEKLNKEGAATATAS